MVKKTFLLLIVAFGLLMVAPLNAQTLSQVAFIINKAMPSVENIAVLTNKVNQPKYEAEAKTATLVSKKTFHVYGVTNVGQISKSIYTIQKLKNVVVVTIPRDAFLNERSIKYAAQKLGLKRIPVISTRPGDTMHGAILSIFEKDGNIEKHVNKVVAAALKIDLPDAFLKECVVDVKK